MKNSVFLDPEKISELESEAARCNARTKWFSFWREVAHRGGCDPDYGSTLAKRVRDGRPFRRPTATKIAAGIGDLLGRPVALAAITRTADRPASYEGETSGESRKGVGSNHQPMERGSAA